jgi:hypothetical protein
MLPANTQQLKTSLASAAANLISIKSNAMVGETERHLIETIIQFGWIVLHFQAGSIADTLLMHRFDSNQLLAH